MLTGGSDREREDREQSLKSVELDAFYWPFTTSYFLSRAMSGGVKPHASFRRARPTQTGCAVECAGFTPFGEMGLGFHS